MDQIAAVRAAILKLLRQISIYEETLREFEAVRKQKDELEGAYLEERRLFEEKVTALHADIAKTEESLKDELKKRDTLNSDLSERADAMENNLTRERSENFRLQKELGRLSKELNQIKSGNKEEVEGLMKQLEDYCLERQALVDAREKAEIAARVERTKQCPGCLDLRKGLSGLKDEIFKKDLDLGNADFRIGELTKQTELMQEESNRKGADLDKLRAAVAALEGERREARAKQEKMVREYAAALRDLEGLRVQAEAENREFAIQLDAEDQVRKSAEKASRPPENRSLFERNEFEDLHLRTNELLQSASVNGGLRSSASRQSQAGESDFRNGAGNGSGYHYQNQQPLVRPQQQH
uniref:Uncharacterized protein n=1 Tax=Heterosigma akashiwo TaxID=2829 RepID=A0A6V1QL89_HETAK